MIVSCGISLVDNNRIRESEKKFGNKFLNYLFTKEELDYCCSKKVLYQRLGARFAAKCALYQALNWDNWRVYKSVKIIKNDLGAPAVCVKGKLKEYVDKQGYKQINLTMSHINDYSIAQVIIEK